MYIVYDKDNNIICKYHEDKRIVTDDKDRTVISLLEGAKILVLRHEDLTEEQKNRIVEIYEFLSKEDGNHIKDFLNYNDDTFCS